MFFAISTIHIFSIQKDYYSPHYLIDFFHLDFVIQLKKNKIYLLLQAESFSKKREKQINLPVYQNCKLNCLTKEELGIAFGKKNIANIGFLKSSFINSIISDSYRLQNLRN